MRGLKTTAENYPPIFAVVMRRSGATRLLECHAFACETEEDAVAAAATLYRALLADLDGNRRRPRHTNGVGCVSLASIASSVRELSPNSRISSRRMNVLQPEQAMLVASHPVRPPRTKKTSVSSFATEDEAGKSVEVQQVPRRKKMNSDIKAEDILEARGRRREPTPKGKASPIVQNLGSNQKSFDLRVSKEEERQNSKNKLYGMKIEPSTPEKIQVDHSVDQMEKVYDTGSIGLYDRVSNRYEKLPVKPRTEKENNLGNSPSKDAVDLKKDYKRYNSSCDLNPPEDAMGRHGAYSPRQEILTYDRIEKSSYKSEENSVYEHSSKRGSKERLYEDHFKDAEKIYTLAQDDAYSGRSSKLDRGKIRSPQEDIFFSKPAKSDTYQIINESFGESLYLEHRRSRDQEKVSSGRKVSRVVTMDKPLKKHLSESSSNLNMPEYSEPRVRKRSRAGSEPPLSRSDDAMKIMQESKLKRSQSDVDMDRGDLMTRVELPRRGSFLKPGSARRPNSIKGGTPLGFTELFDEFRNQEGLTSVDDILAAIIGKNFASSFAFALRDIQFLLSTDNLPLSKFTDPEGMSFNDLKPLYKEFLLKLAATLTQDELYQRSASIMRRRRRPQRRRSSRRSCLLGRAIKRSVSRLKCGPTEFTSVIFPARRLNDSFGSSSSCDARNNHRNRVLANRTGKRSSWRMSKSGGCHTTSEDSDTCKFTLG